MAIKIYGTVYFSSFAGSCCPMAKASAHSADPDGNTMAITDAIVITRMMPRGSIPATSESDAAIGESTAAVPVLDMNVVITMVTTANARRTAKSYIPIMFINLNLKIMKRHLKKSKMFFHQMK